LLNTDDDLAHFESLPGLEEDFRDAACLGGVQRAFHLHGFHDGYGLFFGDAVAQRDLETKELSRHERRNLAICAGNVLRCRRMVPSWEIVGPAVQPHYDRIAAVKNMVAMTFSGDLDKVRHEFRQRPDDQTSLN